MKSRIIGAALASVGVSVGCATAMADPNRVYVNIAATGANTGATWQDAATDLAKAIQDAPVNSEVWVARGVYYPTGPAACPGSKPSIWLRSGVAIYGGFAGTEVSLAERNPTANETVLSGDIGRNDPAIVTDNAMNVVAASGVDSTAVLNGFTIRQGGGYFLGHPCGFGGGMQLRYSSPTIVDCRFDSNIFFSASSYIQEALAGPSGGAVAIAGGAPTFLRCVFTNCAAGAGIPGGCQTGHPWPGDRRGGDGGAVYMYDSAAPQFIACTFFDNRAGDGGAGTVCSPGAVGGGNGGRGGAVYASNSMPTFVNCIFAGNAPGAGGAGVIWGGGPLPPGAAGTGGAVYFNNSTATITGCTAVDNLGTSPVTMSAGSIRSSIVRNASGISPGTCSVSYTMADPPIAGPGNIIADPTFVNSGARDYRLQAISACVDAGDSGAFPSSIAVDQAGRPRFVDIPFHGDGGTGVPPYVDMGALETQLCPGDFNHNGIVSVQDVFDFLGTYFTNDPSADINGDGHVTVEDLFAFLVNYFSPC